MYRLNVINAVRKEIKKLPSGLQAAMLDGLEELAQYGVALKEPNVRDLGRHGLKELRINSQEGIARSLFFFEKGKQIYIVLTYQKKTQKTPQSILIAAEQRMKALKRSINNEK